MLPPPRPALRRGPAPGERVQRHPARDGLPVADGAGDGIGRRRFLAGAKAGAWARHHVEEVGNLVHFLPGLWAGQTGVAPDPGRR